MPPETEKKLFEQLRNAPNLSDAEADAIESAAAVQEVVPAGSKDERPATKMTDGIPLDQKPGLDHRRKWEREHE